jgi:glycosyltransferase involved in cell wall biosynthesis
MRLALIAPTYERVPPIAYGGTEAMVGLLADELVRRGHDVTLFATGDSRSRARIASVTDRPHRYGQPDGLPHPEYVHLANAHAAFLAAADGDFDLLHNQAMVEGLALAAFSTTPVLTTCHNAYAPETAPIWGAYPWYHHALSRASAQTFPQHGALRPIHHGIDVDSFRFGEQGAGYLLFLGRFAPTKGAKAAIEVARVTGRPLILAGKVDRRDRRFFAAEIEPEIDGRLVRYAGEVDGEAKRGLLAAADALLFPIEWDEPFGLVMIEALASGTPVVGFRRASVPEIVDHGGTGFVVDDVAGMAAAVERIGEIDRRTCRITAEARFTVERMAVAYEDAYATVIDLGPARPIAGSGSGPREFVGSGR